MAENDIEALAVEQVEVDEVEGDDKYRLMLLNLLAVIHRDGGHKTHEIGVKLAHEQAMQLSSERIVATDSAAKDAEIAAYREALEKIERTPAWGYPGKWETTPTEVRQLARAALANRGEAGA